MNELQKKYNTSSTNGGKCRLQIFGFPCNQFGFQEPAENFELMNTLKYVRPGYGFEPNFPLAGKLKVNGQDESPIFTYLKARCAAPMGLIANRTDITWTPIRNNDISWNFGKWLIGHDGHPFRRYTSATTPQAIEEDIQHLIRECESGQTPCREKPPCANNEVTANDILQSVSATSDATNKNAQPVIAPPASAVANPASPQAPVAQKQKRYASSKPLHDGLSY